MLLLVYYKDIQNVYKGMTTTNITNTVNRMHVLKCEQSLGLGRFNRLGRVTLLLFGLRNVNTGN